MTKHDQTDKAKILVVKQAVMIKNELCTFLIKPQLVKDIKMKLLSLMMLLFLTMPVSSAYALEDGDFWSAVRVHWGQYASPENVTILKTDVTCDGVEDYIGSRINLDNPDGPFFEVFLVSDQGDDRYTEGQSLPYTGSSEQFGICGEPGVMEDPEIFAEKWDQKDIDDTLDMDVCHTPIGVSDGMCDIVYFFWNQQAKQDDETRLVFFRN